MVVIVVVVVVVVLLVVLVVGTVDVAVVVDDVEVVVGDIGVVFIAPLEIVLLLKFELEIEDVVISDVLLLFSRVLILDLLEIEEEEKGFY